MSISRYAERTALLARHLLSVPRTRGVAAMSTGADMKRDVGRLRAEETILFVCDIQERFRTMIHNFAAVVDTTNRLIRGAQLLDIPVIVTEQYPKALGRTVLELTSVLPPNSMSMDKTKFSMCIDPVWEALRQRPGVRSVLIAGIEAHVCVFQTCLDLLEKGYAVHVLSDAVSSKRPEDRSAALARLRDAGAWIATSEMVLFQLMGNTSHPAFKNVSALVKEDRPPLLPPQ